ncbi:MAG: Na/Pi cotransporter family protein [Candidatus Omnitrophica bacterium]|nr:Na/Pi cotransporter family protein [Candidatus Omnitrophota bacterium]MBU1784085.1 Na/Pi cotransporter family protein [Candidatus Omnitrophota bacterium]
MTLDVILPLIGGVGLFFFGMRMMSEGLKKIAGDRLKNILHMVTRLPMIGILVGAAVTCLIQSSSATTVMVVGLVNAGLLVLKQAISVIIGANIGTTFTAWLVSSMSVFKVTQYALPLVGIGFAVETFGRTKKARFWGQVLMGFGLLFVGLGFMQDAFAPLKESQRVKDMFVALGDNPMLGVLVGMGVTMLIQSSSATIAIVQVMAFNGLISFPTAIALMLGGDIGTTITAQLAAIGTNLEARRAAMSHTLFNVINVGGALIFVFNGWFVKAVEFIVPGTLTTRNIMVHIAVANSLLQTVSAMAFLPFIGRLARVCEWLVPKKKGAIEMGPQYLEKHLLETPPIALEQARHEAVRMTGLAYSSVSCAIKSFFEKDLKPLVQVPKLEQAVDNLQSAITGYLIELSQRDLTPDESEILPVLIHNVNDIERIGDHAENIAELAERVIEKKLSFSDEASGELRLMWNELNSMMIETEDALRSGDHQMARNALKREKTLNIYQVDFKNAHVSRISRQVCDLLSGVVFTDFVDNLEKIGDHLTNIVQGVLGEMRWQGREEEDKELLSE